MLGGFLNLIELDFDPSNSDYESLALSAATGCVPWLLGHPLPQEGTEAAVPGELLLLSRVFRHTELSSRADRVLSPPLTVAVVFLLAESPGCAAVPCGLSPVPTGQGGHEPL